MFEHCSSPGHARTLQPLSGAPIAYVVAATGPGIALVPSQRAASRTRIDTL